MIAKMKAFLKQLICIHTYKPSGERPLIVGVTLGWDFRPHRELVYADICKKCGRVKLIEGQYFPYERSFKEYRFNDDDWPICSNGAKLAITPHKTEDSYRRMLKQYHSEVKNSICFLHF